MNKSKWLTVSTISAAVAGSAAYFFKDNTRFKQYLSDQKRKYLSTKENDSGDLPIEKAGHPHPENIPDNEMVSEGAQFGVQYYEKKKSN